MDNAIETKDLPAPTPPRRAPDRGRTVLVVDDSRLQRRILGAQIRSWGYRVEDADGLEGALARLRDGPARIVISDVDMPGGSGLDLCRRIRDRGGGYVWFVLLTAAADPHQRVAGLESGADDFLAKPVAAQELRARLAVAERILDMEARLAAERARLAEALADKDRLAALVERDLREGRRVQRSLMPPPEARHGPLAISVMLRASGQVGGDLVGHFPTGRGRVGFYGIDVSGHGIAAALMTARLKGYLSDQGGENVAVMRMAADISFGRPPAKIVAHLNDLSLREMRTDHYFTMFYGELDPATGALRYVQAGHPGPLVLRADGRIETVGRGGLPVGLLEDATWDEGTCLLAPGDRILVHSDGLTECEGPDGLLGDEGLQRIAAAQGERRGSAFLEALLADVAAWGASAGFQDDVSALLLEWDRPVGA